MTASPYYLVDRPGGDLGGDEQAPAGEPGDLDGVEEALLGGHPPDEAEVLAGRVGAGRRPEGDAMVDHRRVDRRMHPALVVADRDHAGRRVPEGLACPRLVEPSVEGRGDRDVGPAGQIDIPAIDVGVDQVELVLLLQDQVGDPAEVRLRIASEPGRPERPGNCWHVPAGHLESPLAKVVTSCPRR